MTRKTCSALAALGKKRSLMVPLAVASFLALFIAPAHAAKTHHPITEVPFTEPHSVAVDDASGNVFVVNVSFPNFEIDIVGPEGGAPSDIAPPFRIEGLKFNILPEVGLAIDNSATSPSRGALYVIGDHKEGHSAVKKFVRDPISEKYGLEKELIASPPLDGAKGIAVDSKGNVFVGDGIARVVVEFGADGTEKGRFEIPAAIGEVRSLAVDSAGDLFVLGANKPVLYRFDANGSGEVEVGTEAVQIVAPSGGDRVSALAIDPNTDDLYVAFEVGNGSSADFRIDQLSAFCTPEGSGSGKHCATEGEFGSGSFGNLSALAANSETGFVYAVDTGGQASHPQSDVAVFGPTLLVPGSETGGATGVTGTTAVLNGTVDPSGEEVDECKFEWGLSKSYEHTASCAESPVQIGAGNAPVPVHVDISGLALGSEYHFRLAAANSNNLPGEKGPSQGADAVFTTLGPQIHAESVSGVSDRAARLEGSVNPNGEETSYVFEYVSAANFAASEYTDAVAVPLGGEAIGAGSGDVAVAQGIGDLLPSTSYHFRITATNATGIAHGTDMTFGTYAQVSATLPDGRNYEQVTPVDKNGTAPRGEVGRVQAAPDGTGIVYFAHGGIPGSEGAQKDPLYLSSRSSDWSTQGLLPPASAGASASVMGWEEGLLHAYVSQGVLPGGKSPVGFLERDNATHSLQEIASEEDSELESFNYVDASEHGSVVAFESSVRLAAAGGTATGSNLYVWDEASDQVSLAGVFNTEQAPAKGSLAGSNELDFRRHLTQAQHTLSSDGARLFFTDGGTGQLYLRQNPAQPQSPMVGKVCADPELACTIQLSAKGKKPATFWAATPDGGFAFFTSPDELTTDANTGPTGEGSDLYRYDANAGALIDVTPDPTDANGAEVRGVLGASDDGSYVYFAANGVLTSTPNAQGQSATAGNCTENTTLQPGIGSCNLYLWHEGVTQFVVQLQLSPSSSYVVSDGANWVSALVPQRPEIDKSARVSPDGSTLLFRSQQRLTGYDNEKLAEFYLYTSSGDLHCVSCNPTGASPVGPPSLRSLTTILEAPGIPASVLSRNLAKGRVFFETRDKLTASDVNGVRDVYEWEAKGTGSCESSIENGGCLYLISTGTAANPSYFGDASVSGNDAFFFTDQPLVGQDKDQIADIYDARVGGMPQEGSPPAPICPTAEACRGGVATPPVIESPGTSSFSGPGNQKPPRHKKKHHHHKKKHKTHKKRHAAGKHG